MTKGGTRAGDSPPGGVTARGKAGQIAAVRWESERGECLESQAEERDPNSVHWQWEPVTPFFL